MSTVSETITRLKELAAILLEKKLVVSVRPIEDLVDQLKMWSPKGKHQLKYRLRGLEFIGAHPQYIRGDEWEDVLRLKLDADIIVNGDEFEFSNVDELTVNIHYDAIHIDGKACKGAWHLDLHVPPKVDCSVKKKSKVTTNDETRFMHPDFHFHHGGKKLDDLDSYGNVILLDTPRVMHHPLDLFLAVDFVVSNFVLCEHWQDLRNECRYRKIIEQAQDSWWRPYYQALGDYWSSKGNSKGKLAQDNIALSKKLNPHLL